MKKVLCALLIAALCAGLFAGCGLNTPQTTAPAEETTARPLPGGALDMEAFLRDLAERYPGDDAPALAARILESPYFALFRQEDVSGYYPALDYDFHPEGVKDAAYVWDPFSGSRTFVYVFTAGSEAAAGALAKALPDALDPYWTETPPDRSLAFAVGSRVFFSLYNDGMEPVSGPVAEKARDFVEMFHAFLQEKPNASPLETAEYFAAHQKVASLVPAAVEPGRLTGFGDFENEVEISGFAEGAVFAPEMTPNTFIGYVFRLDDGADTNAFVKTLEDNANLGWNVCMFADTVITETEGDRVLFMMCSEAPVG